MATIRIGARTARVPLAWLTAAAVIFSFATLTAFPGNTRAQERPSLADLQAQIDALEGAYCADVSASASFCPPLPPNCSCDLNTPYPAGSSCTEVAAGDYEVEGDITYTASCAGQCVGSLTTVCSDDSDCAAGELCNVFVGLCQYDVGGVVVCTSTPDCPGNSACVTTVQQGTCSDTGAPCFTFLDCAGGTCDNAVSVDQGACTEDDPGGGLKTCTSSFECAPGSTCSNLLDGNSYCTTGASCGVTLCSGGGYPDQTLFAITNVGAAGSGAIATCGAINVDADEALYCIGLVEAELGSSCVPLP